MKEVLGTMLQKNGTVHAEMLFMAAWYMPRYCEYAHEPGQVFGIPFFCFFRFSFFL